MTNQDNRSMDAADPSANSSSSHSTSAVQALRQKAEALARERFVRAPEDIAALSPEDIRKTLHELRVHQIELEMQNEELRTAQAQIGAGRARYFDLYDLAPVGYCTVSEKGLILETNLMAAALLGTTRTLLVKQPLSRFILKEDQDIYYLRRKQLFETGEPQECELRLVKPDGAKIWAHLTATAAQAEDGVPVCRVVLSDVTNRKREEELLERYKNIVSSTTDAIAYLDQNYRYILANNAYEDFSGVNRDDFVGMTVAEYLGKEVFEEKIKPNLDKCLNGEIVNYQEWFEYPTKGKRFVDVTYFPYRDENNHISGVIANTRDITEGKQAEEALKASEMRFKELLLNVPAVAVQGYAPDGTVSYWNRASETLYGYTAEEAFARNLPDLIIPPAMRDAVGEMIRRMVETGEAIPASEVELMRKDGSLVPVYSSHALVQLPGQEPELFCIDIDLTERKQAEAEREKLREQLFQSQKMESVGRLAGGVAHDFNNMLSVILGHAELALENLAPDHPVYADLKEIDSAGRRSAGLVRQLLAFARKQVIAPIALDLNETVEGMLKMLRRLIGENIDLVWLSGQRLWPVRMDPSQIDQILANLCVNARDAIDGIGRIAIETRNVTIGREHIDRSSFFVPGDYVLLAVTDDGCGMDPETLSHLFEPFFTKKEVGAGTGLGLATIHGIVHQNNGCIDVDTAPGRGTTFKIYIPRHQAASEAFAADGAGQPLNAPVSGGDETVLLVEDEPAILEIGKTFLERLGYRVLIAATPEEAIRLARQHTGDIHLLMTDVIMPEMNGRDLAVHVASLYPQIKCLFMSGYTADIIAGHGVLDDDVHFIQKPFSRAALAAKVREALLE
jgi:two-component system, cell cycle sensor histidine kinase and response regulator CckA